MNKKHRDLKLSSVAFSAIESNYHDDWKDLELLYRSKHSKEFIELAEEQERSHLFIPLGKSTIDILDSIFSSAFFGAGNPLEITKNEADESQIASCLNVLVDYYYKTAKPYISLNMAFSSAARFGLGAVLPYWCDVKKLPITKFIPATDLAFDVDALTRDEIQYTTYRFKQTKQDIAAKIENKFYNKATKKNRDDILGSKYDQDDQKYKRVLVTEVYSVNALGTYTVRSFINKILVREEDFKKNPIKHGFLAAVLPTIDTTLQDDQCAAVGESALAVIQELVKELNQKRNQIVDINECIIDPYTMVGDDADIAPDDAGRIKGTVNVGNPDKVKRFPPTSPHNIENEVALLLKDVDDASAINGMQRGQTSTSDRRPASAMAMINANSSARLSNMATTINDTLFNDWAEAFVRDIYVNAPDELIVEKFGSNPLGSFGLRQEMDYVVNVNFGQSINRDVKISELTMLLQMLNGREDAEVMPVIAEVLKLILGDAYDIGAIFPPVLGDGGDELPAGSVGEEAFSPVGESAELTNAEQQGGIITLGSGTGDARDDQHDESAAAQNQI